MTLLELISIILAHVILFVIVFIMVALAAYLLVFAGLANRYGKQAGMIWLKKILRRRSKSDSKRINRKII